MIFVVVIFILQDYKKIEAFKSPLLLLGGSLPSPRGPSSCERNVEKREQIEKSVAASYL